MMTLVRIELLKLRTTPAAYAALALAFFLTLASVLTTILLAGQPGTSPVGSVDNVSHVLAINPKICTAQPSNASVFISMSVAIPNNAQPTTLQPM